MDKKSYIKPMIEVVELESKALMYIGSVDENDLALKNDRFVTEDEQMARGRRGKWGNLWYEE
ncbi:MAG: hypothetical protein J6S11_01895 [Bacteroidaceae bacterium]|nr:hypothetical protein [Bacteroidaceae bacterium]